MVHRLGSLVNLVVPVEGASGAEADHRGRKMKDLGLVMSRGFSAQLCLLEKDPLAFEREMRRLGKAWE